MPILDPEKRRAYHRAYMREYLKDPDAKTKHAARRSRSTKNRRGLIDAAISRFRSNGCALCEEKAACCLDAHHIDPGNKDFSVGLAKSKMVRPALVEAELKKCLCVCRNCHAKIHAGVITIHVGV